MDKKTLLEKVKYTDSAVDLLNLKPEIIKALEGDKPKKKKEVD